MERFIYKTTNILNGKIYIGQHSTENLDDGYLGSGVILQKAFKKHGKENFKREIIAWADTKEDLNHAEEFFIKHYIQKVGKKNMYNATEYAKGGSMNGLHHTDESKLKMSAIKKGRPSGRKGYHHTEETRQKISKTLKNHTFTEEEKKKISEIHKGYRHTEEAKKKVAEILKNRPDLSKKVLCMETKTIYPGVNEASRETGIHVSNISNVCTGKVKTNSNGRKYTLKTAGGYHWKYI